MEFELRIWLESRYGKVNSKDAIDLENKIKSWLLQIQDENNNQNKHLGLHFKMIDRDVQRTK